MASQSRIASLESKHGEADALLAEERRRPMPDDAAMATIKRRKLSLKDAMVRAGS